VPGATIIGAVPTEPRQDEGQPGVSLSTFCPDCGKEVVVHYSWEEARQLIATLEARLAENMRQLPRRIA